MFALLLAAGLIAPAQAVCPVDEAVLGELVCEDTVSGDLSITDRSSLDWTYSCGTPFDALAQTGPDHLYTYICPDVGFLRVAMTGATCDFDLYVLDDSCDPESGCRDGATDTAPDPVIVNTTCEAPGEMLNIIVEAWAIGAGGCTDGNYTLQFDLEEGVCDVSIGTGTGTGTGTEPTTLTADEAPYATSDAPNTFGASGATPGEDVFFILGARPGIREVPGCAGSFINTSRPIVLGSATADGDGNAEISADIPALASGRSVNYQVVELSSCSVSPVTGVSFL
jgi:hypothetical protein